MFIWYTFKILDSFIKSLDGIEIPSEDIILAACFCFPRILFREVLLVLVHAILA